MKRAKVRETFTALCGVEKLCGILNVYRGVICYLPEDKFRPGDRVRVTVELVKRKENRRG